MAKGNKSITILNQKLLNTVKREIEKLRDKIPSHLFTVFVCTCRCNKDKRLKKKKDAMFKQCTGR